MGDMTTETFLGALRTAIVNSSDAVGITCDDATILAYLVESAIRESDWAGGRAYIHAKDKGLRDSRVRADHLDGGTRDTICARHGISRRTFYRITGNGTTSKNKSQ